MIWNGHKEGRHDKNEQLQMADSIEGSVELLLNIWIARHWAWQHRLKDDPRCELAEGQTRDKWISQPGFK
jgi:hypothetical protein